jgi:hypothetical protein
MHTVAETWEGVQEGRSRKRWEGPTGAIGLPTAGNQRSSDSAAFRHCRAGLPIYSAMGRGRTKGGILLFLLLGTIERIGGTHNRPRAKARF